MKKKLTIVIEYLTEVDRVAALRKIKKGDYKPPVTVGDGPPCKFSDKELDGTERLRYKISSKLED